MFVDVFWNFDTLDAKDILACIKQQLDKEAYTDIRNGKVSTATVALK